MTTASLYYVVHKSPDAPPEGAPLLLLLHGYGADEEDLLGLAPHLDARLICVSARAPYALDFGGFAWFNIEIGAEGLRFAFAEAEEPLVQVLALVDALRQEHRPTRVFIAGFSQGASMALAAALKRPRDFAGVIALSGLCCPEMLPENAAVRDLKVFMSHGHFDPVIPIAQARASRDLLLPLGLDLQYKEYDMPHAIAPPCLEDLDAWLRARLDTP
ncbi:MAG: alpha/beta fold hydrolase [Gemmatimonadetes bacterium]|nr:alpha/beta fold hydrolase [Gemmatimonadota bacterium]MYK39660.1 alpha/beta fold hydrolase [Gemmatimonadota bacterium]